MTDQARSSLGSLAYFLFLVLPVLVYLYRRAESKKRVVLDVFALWFLWYLPYAPLHEACHFLGGRLVGMHLQSHQFIPPFWRGDFIHGHLTWKPAEQWQVLFSTQAPYAIDGLLVLLGLSLFCWRSMFNPFIGALILTQTFLRSLYDVAVNYSFDTVFSGTGDFQFLLRGYSRVAVHIGAWTVMLLAVVCAAREIVLARSKGFSETGKEKGQALEPVPS